ncbi:MAG TPA: sugar ABC transporter permease [Chloroflexota bacterium]|nr:sugar ABC transporter permease [Chloroflexota bacterium]
MADIPLTGQPPQTRRRWLSEETMAGYITISPWIIGFLIFTLIPIVLSIYFSFTRYNVLTPAHWVGLQNYRQLLTKDPVFVLSIKNTLIYTVMFVPLHVGIALAVALLLNEARHWDGIFRTLFYLPSITPAVATAYLWIWILNPQVGLVNRALSFFHIPAIGWTVDPMWVKPTIVISQLWLMGATIIILLAGLKNVPKELYEAAKLDGANAWDRFRSVTLPMISGVVFFLAIVDMISALNIFTPGVVMFDQNGGPGRAGLFVIMYLFNRAFQYFQMGYASAIAWLLFLVIVAMTIFQFWLSKRWVYYESGES